LPNLVGSWDLTVQHTSVIISYRVEDGEIDRETRRNVREGKEKR
jgi:hypothetical protein